MEIVYLLLVVSGFFFKMALGKINNLKSIFRMYHCVQYPKAVSLSYTTTIQNELQVEGSEYIYMYQVV